MGWKYSDIEEKWYGNPNCLVEGIGNGSNEHFSHNLQSLQIKTFDYQNQTYYHIKIYLVTYNLLLLYYYDPK